MLLSAEHISLNFGLKQLLDDVTHLHIGVQTDGPLVGYLFSCQNPEETAFPGPVDSNDPNLVSLI